MPSRFVSNQVCNVFRYRCCCIVAVGMSCVDEIVKSSAYDIIFMLAGERGVSCVKVKSSMARSLPVENLLPQNVGSIINYLQ